VLAKQAKEKSYFLGAIDAGQGIVLFEATTQARDNNNTDTTADNVSQSKSTQDKDVKSHIFTASLPLKHVLQQLIHSDSFVHETITSEDNNKVWQMHFSIADTKIPATAYEREKQKQHLLEAYPLNIHVYAQADVPAIRACKWIKSLTRFFKKIHSGQFDYTLNLLNMAETLRTRVMTRTALCRLPFAYCSHLRTSTRNCCCYRDYLSTPAVYTHIMSVQTLIINTHTQITSVQPQTMSRRTKI
jgi:hypothetical protein